MQLPHSKLLTDAARARLRPLGLTQKGRSRIWLDDRQWFVTVVEFQPSSWSRGSYLNVRAHFLWQWSGHLSFDLGNRVECLAVYESDSQFAAEADRLALRATTEVLSLRRRLPEPQAVASALYLPERGRGWPHYHRAVSLGLSDQPRVAAQTFLEIAEANGDDREWVLELRERCRRLAILVVDPPAFREEMNGLIARQRSALKLPAVRDVLSR